MLTYIDIGSIDRDRKLICETSDYLGAEAPSRARQLVEAGDILVSTVRPNLNAIAEVPEALDGATASTGFSVLRPDPTLLDSRYLYHWVQTPQFVDSMIMQATGASYPAVTDKIVKASTIPLPPLDEQKRIAAVLDAADALRAKRRAALAKLDTLLQSVFLEMFGDPVTNPMGWEAGSIDDIVSNRRDVRCGPFGTQLKVHELVDAGVPLFGIENVQNDRFVQRTTKFLTDEKAEKLNAFDVRNDDVLVTRMGTIGRACVVSGLESEARFSYHLFRVRPEKRRCLPEFLASTIAKSGTFQQQLERLSHGAIMAGLSTANLRAVRFLIPPIEYQQLYLERVREIETQRQITMCSSQQFEELFLAIQQAAFTGSL